MKALHVRHVDNKYKLYLSITCISMNIVKYVIEEVNSGVMIFPTILEIFYTTHWIDIDNNNLYSLYRDCNGGLVSN